MSCFDNFHLERADPTSLPRFFTFSFKTYKLHSLTFTDEIFVAHEGSKNSANAWNEQSSK